MRNSILFIIVMLLYCNTSICHASDNQCTFWNQTVSKPGPRTGVVNRDGVAGAVSKEADKLFTQYANNNDTEGITQMLISGQLVYLPKGTRVVLIEYGFFLHKIRTKEGQILYVSRERITLEDDDANKK